MNDISVSVQTVLPSFNIHRKESFSSNLHRLASTQWHYEVVFENDSGERAGAKPALAGTPVPYLPAGDNKAEAIFLKRAKRYAKSEGHIDAAQRADLEAFAKKYGIDGLRMEALIEEAFD